MTALKLGNTNKKCAAVCLSPIFACLETRGDRKFRGVMFTYAPVTIKDRKLPAYVTEILLGKGVK
jgi:hypothetical protein